MKYVSAFQTFPSSCAPLTAPCVPPSSPEADLAAQKAPGSSLGIEERREKKTTAHGEDSCLSPAVPHGCATWVSSTAHLPVYGPVVVCPYPMQRRGGSAVSACNRNVSNTIKAWDMFFLSNLLLRSRWELPVGWDPQCCVHDAMPNVCVVLQDYPKSEKWSQVQIFLYVIPLAYLHFFSHRHFLVLM